MKNRNSLLVEEFNDFSRRNKTGETKLFFLEYYNELKNEGICLPEGFVIYSSCFDMFCAENDLEKKLQDVILSLRPDFENLKEVSFNARALILTSTLPEPLASAIQCAGKNLQKQSPTARMVLKSYKNYDSAASYDISVSINNEKELLDACLQGFASLFSEKAIRERVLCGCARFFGGIYMTVQRMIRSDISGSGLISTEGAIEGEDESIVLYGCWGLSQSVISNLNSYDEYHISRPLLRSPRNAVYSKRAGTKEKTLVYFNTTDGEKANLFYIDTPLSKRDKFVISDKEVSQLARWAVLIEQYYGQPLQMEWAKDGLSNELYIVHAPVSRKTTDVTST